MFFPKIVRNASLKQIKKIQTIHSYFIEKLTSCCVFF